MPSAGEKRRVDMRDKRREITRDCRDYKRLQGTTRLQSLQGIADAETSSVSRLSSVDCTGGKGNQFLPDVPQSLRYEERWRSGQSRQDSKSQREWKRNGRLVGAAKTGGELAEWRRL